jgi:Alternative splicing regulator
MSYYNVLRKVVQIAHNTSKQRKKDKQAAELEAARAEKERDPFEKLILEGRAAQLHKDTNRGAAATAEASLVPCHGRRDVLIDR